MTVRDVRKQRLSDFVGDGVYLNNDGNGYPGDGWQRLYFGNGNPTPIMMNGTSIAIDGTVSATTLEGPLADTGVEEGDYGSASGIPILRISQDGRITQASVAAVTPGAINAQPVDATLTALSGKATAADLLPYFTGTGAASTTAFTTFARSLLAGTSAAAMLTTLGAAPTSRTLTAGTGLTGGGDLSADRTLAVAVPLPAVAGQAANIPRVNAGGTAIEYRTPAQTCGDIGAVATNGDGSAVTVAPTGGTTSRTLAARAGDRLTAKDLGATGDGTTDDRAALALAGSADLILPPGTYVVGSDLTIGGPVRFAKGAKIKATGAVTITFAGGIHAPLAQIFDLSGGAAVAFSNGCLKGGHPEWWGAIRNDAASASINTVAITACIVACPVTKLQAADYFHSATIDITTSHRVLQGVSTIYAGANTATRLVNTSAAATSIYIRKTPDPGTTIDNFLRSVTVRDIEVTRSVAPDSNPVGLLLEKTLYACLERVYSCEHGDAFRLAGTVHTKLHNCRGFRSINGTNALMDRFYAFFLDGDASIGAAGGNASTYLTECVAGIGGTPALWDSIGFYLSDGGVDTFLTRPEVSGLKNGIVVSGLAGGTATQQKTRDVDIQITSPIIDAFTGVGLRLTNIATGGAVSVIGGYCAPTTGATYGVQIDGSAGLIHLNGFQVIGWPVTGLIGLGIVNSSGVRSSCMLMDCGNPVLLVGANNCEITDHIRNNTVAPGTASVWAQTTPANTRNKIAPMISGAATSTRGVFLQGGSGTTIHVYNEINCSGIDPSAITGGAGNKLFIAGAAVTTTGMAAGDNLVTGVMS